MTNEQRDKWNELLQQANELRHRAYELESEGLHELATAKMHELQELVLANDRGAGAAVELARFWNVARDGQRTDEIVVVEVRT